MTSIKLLEAVTFVFLCLCYTSFYGVVESFIYCLISKIYPIIWGSIYTFALGGYMCYKKNCYGLKGYV